MPENGSQSGSRSAQHVSSGGLSGSGRLSSSDVDLWLANDLPTTETCDLDSLLEGFLEFCRTKPESHSLGSSADVQNACSSGSGGLGSTNGSLLPACLELAIPMCNSSKMKEELERYCAVKGPETSRYPPFVNAFNYALGKLSPLRHPSFRPPSDLNILFHVSDPSQIVARHEDNRKTVNVPDVVVVSTACCQHVSDIANVMKYVAKDCAPRKPESSFSWNDKLTTFEFKLNNPIIVSKSPQRYDASLKHKIGPRTGKTLPKRPKMGAQTLTPLASIFEQLIPPLTVGSGQGEATEESAPQLLRMENTAQMAKSVVDPATQCAGYASELLSRSPGTYHTIDVLIVDKVVWVWWYDRQAMIESASIDFIRDLPRFPVPPLALQRFTMTDWGFNTKLNPQIIYWHTNPNVKSKRRKGSTMSPPVGRRSERMARQNIPIPGDAFDLNTPLRNVVVKVDQNINIYRRCGLAGRCTQILGASSQSNHPVKPHSLAGIKLVVKVSWPNDLRMKEADIINRAKEAGDNLEDYLPDVIAWIDDDYRTRTIRGRLGIEPKGSFSRVLRVIIFERLDKITSLQGDDFVKAWVQAIKCHYQLWKQGIQHQNINEGNLMSRHKDGIIFGVLIDWEQSVVDGESIEVGDRTGTIPFLAIDLLDDLYWEGKIEIHYRHDLESLIWALVWVFCNYEETKPRNPLPLQGWATADHNTCREKKNDALVKRRYLSVTDDWKLHWKLAYFLLRWLHENRESRGQASDAAFDKGDPEPEEVTDAKVYESFFQVLVDVAKKYPSLEFLGDEQP